MIQTIQRKDMNFRTVGRTFIGEKIMILIYGDHLIKMHHL